MAPVGNTKDLEVEKELGAWRETLGCVQWYRSLGIQNGTINIDLDRSEGVQRGTRTPHGEAKATQMERDCHIDSTKPES